MHVPTASPDALEDAAAEVSKAASALQASACNPGVSRRNLAAQRESVSAANRAFLAHARDSDLKVAHCSNPSCAPRR
jgi:hypothetical protein